MHVGQRDHRADRAGAADHDVGPGQRVGQVLQRQRVGPHPGFADLADQPLGPRQRPVEHVDLPDAGAGQVRGGQGAHRSGADQDGGLAGQPAQPAVGHVQGDRHHRGAGGVDGGLGVHPLAHRQRALGQFVQHPAHGAVGFGGGVRAADLAEHLLLADHRRVQAAGHREQVLDGGLAVPDVGVFGEVGHRHPGVVRQHLPDHGQPAVERVHHRVDLDPVACRQHHRLGHQRGLQHPVDDLAVIGFVDTELFQDGDRRTTVRNPEEQDAHGSITWPAPLLPPVTELLSTVNVYQLGYQIIVWQPARAQRARSARSRGSSMSQ
ncbi:hypothetical protein PICSAR78_03148 [Mycobacterium avium subsp. paratuberculosis]|nr:hypothetical protein PICSAR78_03148 [Mycobacterium avium subsp. paratuberculosis]